MSLSAFIRVHPRLYWLSPCSPWSIICGFPLVFKGGLQGGPPFLLFCGDLCFLL